MMKFFRPNNSFGPGNRPSSPTGNGAESSGTAGRQKRNRPIPPPLQLVDQANGGQTQSARDTTGTPTRLLSSRRISEHASGFDFYHAYLTEDQEEEAFKNHLFKTGSFLMRDSKSNSQAVTMSVVIDPLHLYHFQVVQATSCFNVVGTGKKFSSLEEMIEYYKQTNIPGKTDNPVFLKHPVQCNRGGVLSPPSSAPAATSTLRKNGPTTPVFTTMERPRKRLGKNNRRANSVEELPQGSPQTKTFVRVPPSPKQDQTQSRHSQSKLPPIPEPGPQKQPAMELYEDPHDGDDDGEGGAAGGAVGGAVGGAEAGTSSSTVKIDFRPPMPIPRPASEYSRGHDYSEADHPDLDRIKMVLELCRQSDVIHASRKKCTCGLYLEESILVQGWMMHVDNEPGKTQGRIFFLDTKANTTTWSLPEDIATELKSHCPVKWEFVKKQLAAAKKKTTPTTT